MEPYAETRHQYVEFAAHTRGESPCFTAWAQEVAEDREVLAWIGTLPGIKQQPNLVFARLARGRPLALLEVGASAGLCLHPDGFDYEWETTAGPVRIGSGGPRLRCRVTGTPPLPEAPPEVAWRGGIDLNPLDVADEEAMAWLTNLVWPEQDERRDRLTAAIEVARRTPPTLVRGDLVEELPALLERAAAHGPVVVFHSAVVAYLAPEERWRFAELMTGLVAEGVCHWVSNEARQVLPSIASTAPEIPEEEGAFVLGADGRAVALTHGHGQAMTWLADR
ncbi:DUF2332 family protein [Nocardioides sp.]|uniref:DUF2332 family protein n=1 Tax=Nocardioides sp. TaxID=35761 RepID=UPI003568EBA2